MMQVQCKSENLVQILQYQVGAVTLAKPTLCKKNILTLRAIKQDKHHNFKALRQFFTRWSTSLSINLLHISKKLASIKDSRQWLTRLSSTFNTFYMIISIQPNTNQLIWNKTKRVKQQEEYFLTTKSNISEQEMLENNS